MLPVGKIEAEFLSKSFSLGRVHAQRELNREIYWHHDLYQEGKSPKRISLSHNPRRFYPPEDLQAMADSIREAGHPVCAPARCQAGQVCQILLRTKA